MILAHREENVEGMICEQILVDHLYEVGMRAGQIGSDIGLENFMKLAGFLHDIGKADRSFQSYIRGQSKKLINHSSAGGRFLYDYICKNHDFDNIRSRRQFRYFIEILLYIIFAHHGLYDQVTYGSTEHNTYLRICYDEDDTYHYDEDVLSFVEIFQNMLIDKGQKTFTELIFIAFDEFKKIYDNLVEMSQKNCDKKFMREEKEYYFACLTRLCLSILKEADIYDSSNAFRTSKQHLWGSKERQLIWEELVERIEQMYQEYENMPNLTQINKTRNVIANAAKYAAISADNGIFKLELPTGSGKTKTGLRYALANAKIYNRIRIFYITAYLSVLEQNATDIRRVVNKDKIVLEHHSNIIEDSEQELEESEDDDYGVRTYLIDSWENLIILTTMVQFFNTLFKEKSSNIRRFCKLINSVIIIDEVQSLPIRVLSNFNLMMNFMKEIMHCNIVHCTATQPVLDSEIMRYKIYYGDNKYDNVSLINKEKIDLTCFYRVDFYNLTGKNGRILLSCEEIYTYIEKELKTFDSCLIVMNTKSAVSDLTEFLENYLSDVEIIYLTTNLCAAHRLDVISDMKKKLLQNRNEHKHNKIVCISTQLIEAGVDVDFDVVFRAIAGIDSIIQCAGRCNREGKLMINDSYVHGKVYIFRYKENLSHLPDIKATADATEYTLRKWGAIQTEDNVINNIKELQKIYFEKYYAENKSKLDYIDENTSMVEELGRNQPARDAYLMGIHNGPKPVLYQSFRTAAENFELIGQDTVGIIVDYKNHDLLEQLEKAFVERDYNCIRNLLKKLQRYTVNMYITSKILPFIIYKQEYNVYLLQKEYYDEKRGVTIEHLADLIF